MQFVMLHAARQLPSWLTFNVGRKMRVRKRIIVGAVVVSLVCLISSRYLLPAYQKKPTVFTSRLGPANTDKPLVSYADADIKIVWVDYGSGTRQVPGLYVFGRRSNKWVRIDEVLLENSILGHNPTYEELERILPKPVTAAAIAAFATPIGWDFRHLARREYVQFPLSSGGCLFFPDRIERYESARVLIMRFNSGWKVPGVETSLEISLEELFEKLAEG